jgi:hypothetical protein
MNSNFVKFFTIPNLINILHKGQLVLLTLFYSIDSWAKDMPVIQQVLC